MNSGVYFFTDGPSTADSHEKVQSDSIIGPSLHLAIKIPDSIEPVIFDVSHIIKVLFFLVVHLGVIAKITLHPHFVVVCEVVKLIRQFIVLPYCWVTLLNCLEIVHPTNYGVHEEVSRSNKLKLIRYVVNEFVLSVKVHNLWLLHAPLSYLGYQHVNQDS